MGFLGFMKNYGQSKLQQTGQGLLKFLVTWDPETASEAEIGQIEDKLNQVVAQVAQSRQTYQREKAEADQIEALYAKRMKAAEILQAQMASAQGDQAAGIEKALAELVGQLEEMAPEVEREAQEAKEAKEFLDELEEIAKISAEKLKKAHQSLQAARRDMERARIKEERAKDKAEQAAALAGLRRDADEFGSALSAMRKAAAEASAKADAYGLKSRLLAPTDKEKGNDIIAQAMAQAAGEPKPANLAERLAALKKR